MAKPEAQEDVDAELDKEFGPADKALDEHHAFLEAQNEALLTPSPE